MRKKILIVEDEPHLRLLYQHELAEFGYDVILVEDGETAISRMRERNPDLVVLDIQLPRKDGLTILSEARLLFPSCPIILYTAFSSFQDNFLSWGADAYLVKSSDLSELKDKIRELLSSHEISC
jgi:DNA-binding response OmpR family regulator